MELGSSEFLLKCEYGEKRRTHSFKENTSKIDSLSLSLFLSEIRRSIVEGRSLVAKVLSAAFKSRYELLKRKRIHAPIYICILNISNIELTFPRTFLAPS